MKSVYLSHRTPAMLAVLICLLISAYSSCGNRGDSKALYSSLNTQPGQYINNEPPFLGAEEEGIESALLAKALMEIGKGAAGETGSAAMGRILALLGWGSGDNDSRLLASMKSTLEQITNTLYDIQNSIIQLIQQLQIAQADIIANTNDPTDAINDINTLNDQLVGLAANAVGSLNPNTSTAIPDFVRRAESDYKIDSLIRRIFVSVIPDTTAKTPVLDNFTALCLNKGDDAETAYRGLEDYFAQLLYYETKGVNIFTESKVYHDKSNSAQIDGRTASQYIDHYRAQMLKPQLDNFMSNVWYLVISKSDITENDDAFLPSVAPAILARASFFAIQTMFLSDNPQQYSAEDHYGLRGTLVGTQDLVKDVIVLKARNINSGQVYPGEGKLNTVEGQHCPIYDYWEGNKVKPNSTYSVVVYDFGNVPLGDYQILDSSGTLVSAVSVKSYSDEYKLDDSGTISYGHFTLARRMSPTNAFNYNCLWTSTQSSALENVNVHSDCGFNKSLGLEADTQWNKKQSSRTTSGWVQIEAHFVYNGPDNSPLTVSYYTHVWGKVIASTPNNGPGISAKSKIECIISLFDLNANSLVQQLDSVSKTADQEDTLSLDHWFNGKWKFPNPSLGHEYVVVYFLHTEGHAMEPEDYWGQSQAYAKLEMGNISIQGGQSISF